MVQQGARSPAALIHDTNIWKNIINMIKVYMSLLITWSSGHMLHILFSVRKTHTTWNITFHCKYVWDFIKMWPNFHTVSYTHKFHYQQAVHCFYVLYRAPAYFGHTSWPSSGGYEFGQCVQHVWQLVIDKRQTLCVCVCVYIYIWCNKKTMRTHYIPTYLPTHKHTHIYIYRWFIQWQFSIQISNTLNEIKPYPECCQLL